MRRHLYNNSKGELYSLDKYIPPAYLYTKESIPFADKKASISLQIFFALGFSILKTIRAFFKIPP